MSDTELPDRPPAEAPAPPSEADASPATSASALVAELKLAAAEKLVAPEPHEADAPESAQAEAAQAAEEGDGAEEAESEEAEESEESGAATIDQADEVVDTPFDKLVSRARRLSPERTRTILEALLFVCDKPLSEEAIRQVTGLEVATIKEQLQKLQGGYRDGVRGIVLHEVAGGWQFRTDPGVSEFVRRFLKVKPQRLTRAALETLAIIAYRQPVTRPEIEDIRAVDCGAVIKALLERRLIKIIGKKEEVGRPLLYGTTAEFLEFFNLRDLSNLPTLREFQELSEESQKVVEKETGEPAPAPTTQNLVADLKDSTFELKLQQTTAEADAALADLETAMAESESKARETHRILNPAPPPDLEGADAPARLGLVPGLAGEAPGALNIAAPRPPVRDDLAAEEEAALDELARAELAVDAAAPDASALGTAAQRKPQDDPPSDDSEGDKPEGEE